MTTNETEPETHVDAQLWSIDNDLNPSWGYTRDELEHIKATVKPLPPETQSAVEAVVKEINDAFQRLSRLAGLGDCCSHDGYGTPLYLDFYNPMKDKCGSVLDLRMAIWSDINRDEATHIIPLVGASESLRKGEPKEFY